MAEKQNKPSPLAERVEKLEKLVNHLLETQPHLFPAVTEAKVEAEPEAEEEETATE